MKPKPPFSSKQLVFILTFLCFSSSRTVESADLASDRAALLVLRQSVYGRPLLWNTSDSTCRWFGVTCVQDRVVELRLPGMGLSGQLPIALGNLTELQTLSLRYNTLSGPIPQDLALISSLRNLYLQENQFSGEIPAFLFTLQNLVRLNLGDNNFSGEISPEFNKLTRLASLYLEENHFTGSIPNFTTKFDQFNVSFNNLTGSIPDILSNQPKSAFSGNSLCGGPLVSCNGSKSGNKLSGGAIAGIVIGSIIGVLLILLLLICLCRKRGNDSKTSTETETREKGAAEMGGGGGGGNPTAALGGAIRAEPKGSSASKNLVFFGNAPRVYDLEDLLRASAEVLGNGTFGTTYKATLETGVVMAVKRLKNVAVPEKEFREKIEAVGKMDHENLVLLRAYYFSKDEKLLVNDFMEMRSLSSLLHASRGAGRTPLNWESRSGIALGAARGIEYMHSQSPTSSHGNIKSSNILLTKSYQARISDFGLAHLASPASAPNRLDGYRAPEVTDIRKISQKADIYSFGILLLELLTGKAPTHALLNEEGVDLPRWVQSVVKEQWSSEVFDLELLRYQNVEEPMVQLLQLAMDCTVQYPDSRPKMSTVRNRIEEICLLSSREEQDISNGIYSDASGGTPTSS